MQGRRSRTTGTTGTLFIRTWADCIFLRQAEVEAIEGSNGTQYTHIWGGAPAAIAETFRSLSRLELGAFRADGSA